METFDVAILVLLFGSAIVISFVDAISGGGGLLTIPLLLSVGLGPAQALATNKLQGVFGTGSSTYTFARSGQIDFRLMTPAVMAAIAGAALGTIAVQLVSPDILRKGIPVILIAIALYFLKSRRIGDAEQAPAVNTRVYAPVMSGGVSFYDGFLGLGTGSFLVAGLAGVFGYGLRRATAHAKLLNFASNVGSLAFFILGGKVIWVAGFAMAAGQVIGARLGAIAVLRKGAKLVRPLVVVTAIGMALRLIYEEYL